MASQPHITHTHPSPDHNRKLSPEPPKSATSSKFAPSTIGGGGSPQAKKTVVTVPPWARHEQPVPDEDLLSPMSASGIYPRPLTSMSSHERMPSDIASFTSSGGIPEQPHSGNWWTFTVPRRIRPIISEADEDGSTPTGSDDVEKMGGRRRRISKPRPNMKQRNRSSWIFGALNPVKGKEHRAKSTRTPIDGAPNEDVTTSSSESEQEDDDDDGTTRTPPEEAEEEHDAFDAGGPSNFSPRFRRALAHRGSSNLLRLDIPLPPAPFTKAQTETPGWDSPWNPRKYLAEPEAALSRDRSGSMGNNGQLVDGLDRGPSMVSHPSFHRTGTMQSKKPKSTWRRRRRKFRTWCLHNLYVPLLFRITNLAFTSATLGIAVGIRRLEKNTQSLGILGSSSTVTIIFAPVTLVHVLISIYTEYFGRPVGLWKTSAKLSYTLLEVVFICVWAAALALCFNDYFTTALMCGPKSMDRWWSEIPRTSNPLADQMRDDQAGHELCEEQLALICMAFATLTSYCSNLIISLFRIIEKVKSYSVRKTMNWPL